jgi:RNA polymerase sigma-70 factor (ECF subfamily)
MTICSAAAELATAKSARSTDSELEAATREDLINQLVGLIPSLRAFARALAHDPSEVDDLVQETLVKAIANLHQFTPGTNLRAWLFTIQRNAYLTAVKQRRQRAAIPLDDDQRLSVSPSQEWSLQMAAVREAVFLLPSEQRQALLLVAGAGMKYGEAAKLCECALGTIKSRINRARHRLEELLDIRATAFLNDGRHSD